MNKIIQLVTRFTLGKNLSIALMVLKLIADALKSKNAKNIAEFVYERLPKDWKHPKGPATKKEFLETVTSGEGFLNNLMNLTKS